MRATVGNARDHRANDRAYQEYLADKAREDAEAKAAADAAQAAADAQNPELQFKRAADAEAQTVREIILNGYIPDTLLPNAQRIGGRKVLQEPAIRNFQWFAQNTPAFKPHYMGRPLLDAAERSDLAPTGPNYTALFNLMVQYGAFPDEPVQVVAPAPVEEVETRTPSEIAEAKYKARMTEIVVYDPIDNKGYTEFDLENKVDAKTERRLRRLMEGKIGNNNYDTFIEIKDAQFRRDQDIAARAAAEAQEEGR